jgi:hypothetical protein
MCSCVRDGGLLLLTCTSVSVKNLANQAMAADEAPQPPLLEGPDEKADDEEDEEEEEEDEEEEEAPGAGWRRSSTRELRCGSVSRKRETRWLSS